MERVRNAPASRRQAGRLVTRGKGATVLLVLLSGVGAAEPVAGERARFPLIVSSGVPWAADTSVAVSFDHASEVLAGRSFPDGHDVLLLRATDAGLQPVDLVLDPGSAWNRSDSLLWFRLPESADHDEAFFLSVGRADAGLRDASRVFLFFDDFEDCSVGRWHVVRTTQAAVGIPLPTNVAHRGACALLNPSPMVGGFQLGVTHDGGFPQDIALDAWVWMDEPSLGQWAWFLRFDAAGDNSYNLGADTTGGAWRVGHRLAGFYTRYPGAIPFSASPPRQWVRTVASVEGRQLSLCVGSHCLDGGVLGNAGFTASGVGFGRLISGQEVNASARIIIDDVIVRRVPPEAVMVRVGGRLAGPGEPCSELVPCASGVCRGVCMPFAADAGPEDGGADGGGTEADGGALPADGGPPPVDAGIVGTDAGIAAGDGGEVPPREPGAYVVGCGCGSAAGGGASWLGVGCAWLFRRRSLHPTKERRCSSRAP